MPTPKKKNNTNRQLIVIIILLVLCFVIACAVGFYLYQTSQQTTGKNIQQTATAAAQITPLPPQGGENGVTGASPVIYLAGRTDITIPPLDQAYTGEGPVIFACRGGTVQETYPPGYHTQAGAEIQVRARGLVNFYGGDAEGATPPDGSLTKVLSMINAFGGISQYLGPQGSLVGVFLDDSIPNGEPPAPLNFGPVGESEGALGLDFERLEPVIGQVFFIGDGVTSAGKPQVFIAPANATRIFIGLADAADFYGDPSCYTDNTGNFEFTIMGNPPPSKIK